MAPRSRSLAVLAPVERAGGGVLRRLLDLAIDGNAVLPAAREAARRTLERKREHEAAIDQLVTAHIAYAGAQGLLTNLGGLATAVVTIPGNLAGLAVVELRMVATVAHLRGWDVDDARVRSAIMTTLLGPDGDPELPTPLVIATAPIFDAELDRRASERVLADLATTVGGRRAAMLFARRIPVVGGGIGAASDGWATHVIGRWAREQFVDRRPSR